MSLLCTKCKDAGAGEIQSGYYMQVDFPPLQASTEASAITAEEAIDNYLATQRQRIAQEQSEVGRGYRCRECDVMFTADEDRWKPADELSDWREPKTYRVRSLHEALKNQRRGQTDNAKVKMWVKGRRVR